MQFRMKLYLNSFSLLTACCLVRLDEQFLGALLKYFSCKGSSVVRTPMFVFGGKRC